MTVTLIASNQLVSRAIDIGGEHPYVAHDITGSDVVEFGGRACYQSWTRPNEATATNAGYIGHILEVAHGSVLEHGTASMYFTDLSRSCTHELVRHRHFSPSQLSQRFVNGEDSAMIVPPLVAEAGGKTLRAFTEATEAARIAYSEINNALTDHMLDEHPEVTGTARRKAVREAARSVLPNATDTAVLITANYRAWRHFVHLRATEHADAEMRGVALDVLAIMKDIAPAVVADFELSEVNGVTVAHSPIGSV